MILALDVGQRIFAVGHNGASTMTYRCMKDLHTYIIDNSVSTIALGSAAIQCYTIKASGQLIINTLSPIVDIAIVSEYRTSSICPICGRQGRIGINRLFRCKICKLRMDRDEVAAINIYKKYAGTYEINTDLPIVLPKPIIECPIKPDISAYFNIKPLVGRIDIEF